MLVKTPTETDSVAALEAMLGNVDEALQGFEEQLAREQAAIEALQDRLDADQLQLLASAQKVSELGGLVQQGEASITHAKKALGVARGTALEKSTAGQVKGLQVELAEAQKNHEAAKLRHGALEVTVRLDRERIEEQITEAEAARDALLAEQEELRGIRQETFIRLGQAVLREILEDGAAFLAQHREQKESQLASEYDYRSFQRGIPDRLAAWPALLERAVAAHGIPKPPPEPNAQERLVQSLLAHLEVCYKYGPQVGDSPASRGRAAEELQIALGDMQKFCSGTASVQERWGLYQERKRRIEAWMQAHPYGPRLSLW